MCTATSATTVLPARACTLSQVRPSSSYAWSVQTFLGCPPLHPCKGCYVGSPLRPCGTCYSRLHILAAGLGSTTMLCAGDWAQGNMWSCSEFAQHLDASCAQKGLWQNHIQPQMQRIVQYSLACATVRQAQPCSLSLCNVNSLPTMNICSLPFCNFACKDTSGMPIFVISSLRQTIARNV